MRDINKLLNRLWTAGHIIFPRMFSDGTYAFDSPTDFLGVRRVVVIHGYHYELWDISTPSDIDMDSRSVQLTGEEFSLMGEIIPKMWMCGLIMLPRMHTDGSSSYVLSLKAPNYMREGSHTLVRDLDGTYFEMCN